MRKIVLVVSIIIMLQACKSPRNCDAYGDLKNSEKDLALNK
jgi:hypothetical protein